MTNSSVFRVTSSPSLSARTQGRLLGCLSHQPPEQIHLSSSYFPVGSYCFSPLSSHHTQLNGIRPSGVHPHSLMITHACSLTPLQSHSHTCTLIHCSIYSWSQSPPNIPHIYMHTRYIIMYSY